MYNATRPIDQSEYKAGGNVDRAGIEMQPLSLFFVVRLSAFLPAALPRFRWRFSDSNAADIVVVLLLRYVSHPEVLALKHESRILGQWSNPVSGSRKSRASSPWAKHQSL